MGVRMYKNILKRLVDLVLSFFAIVFLSVPMIFVIIAIKIDSRGPAFFKQKRVGKDGKHFNILKFRTMRTDAPHDMPTHLLTNPEAFITKSGSFLRKTSLDELPQFFNVLKGDMSLVGPRPPLPREVEQYTDDQRQRLTVIPGMTCYWQVQPKRNTLSFDDWMAWDIKYISERSFGTDLKILFKTVGAVCGMEGL